VSAFVTIAEDGRCCCPNCGIVPGTDERDYLPTEFAPCGCAWMLVWDDERPRLEAAPPRADIEELYR
jgi:hypothetical protein